MLRLSRRIAREKKTQLPQYLKGSRPIHWASLMPWGTTVSQIALYFWRPCHRRLVSSLKRLVIFAAPASKSQKAFVRTLPDASARRPHGQERSRRCFATRNQSPMADVFHAWCPKSGGRPPVWKSKQAVLDGGERQSPTQLKKRIAGFSTASRHSVLSLDYWETVVGMISFLSTILPQPVAMGTKHKRSPTGLPLALLTTAVGLLIAIPAMARVSVSCRPY
jgi:hypothetical protein